MYCPECGSPNPDNATNCNVCYAQLNPSTPETPTPEPQPVEGPQPIEEPAPQPPVPPTPQPPVPPTPQPPVPPAPQPKSTSNKTPIIIAAVVGAIMLIVIGVLVGTKLGNTKSKNITDEEIEAVEVEAVEDDTPSATYTSYPAEVNNPDERFQSFDWLSDFTISQGDLYGLSKEELRILRNAIFAIHGYKFKSDDLQRYFSRFNWYSADYSDVTPFLSQVEKDNIATIQRMER